MLKGLKKKENNDIWVMIISLLSEIAPGQPYNLNDLYGGYCSSSKEMAKSLHSIH